MSEQFIRKCTLVVSSGGQGIDLSQMRIRFSVNQNDTETPNNAIIRVFNLSNETAQRIQSEYQLVTLQAGYESGDVGVIFSGTIKTVRRGRENPTDTYLDILAADGDKGYNFGTANQTLAAGSTIKNRIDAAAKAMNLPVGYAPDLPAGALSRGKVMFGMARTTMGDAADTAGATWSIQNGQVQVLPLTSYLPGEAVKLNSQTGMIGLPEQTEAGIAVTCLLNPKLKIGGLVQIDNASIQRAFLSGVYLYAPGRLEELPGLLPKITDDGFYRIYVSEFVGDNRGPAGSPWFSKLTCLAVDRTAPTAESVQAYG